MTPRRCGLRIVVHLLVIALIGVLATQACLAEDAPGTGAGSAPSANPDGKDDSKTGMSEGADKGNAAGRDVKPSAPGGKDLRRDRYAHPVQSRRLGKRHELREDDRSDRSLRTIFRPWRSAHESHGRVSRDAIGVPVARPGSMEQRSAEHPLGNNPAGAPTGFGENTSGGVARPGGPLGHTPSNANPNVRPSTLNRGTINGTNCRPAGRWSVQRRRTGEADYRNQRHDNPAQAPSPINCPLVGLRPDAYRRARKSRRDAILGKSLCKCLVLNHFSQDRA